MHKLKIFILRMMFLIFMGIALFCAYQMFLSPEEDPSATVEEEPYPFEEPLDIEVPTVTTEDISLTPTLDYDAAVLRSENADFIGWLMIPDTTVSFPVVLGTDNQFYLKHGFHKEYSRYGCPFLDTRTPPGGDCYVIHGHNMGNNRTEMFSPLANYQNASYAELHKTVLFSLSDSTEPEVYELFAVVNQQLDQGFDYIVSSFETDTDRDAFVNHLRDNSLYDTDFVPKGKLLILSTCNNTYGTNNRLLICLGSL